MTTETSSHLSEEAMNDILIGLGSAEAEGHLRACQVCRAQLDNVNSALLSFNQATLEWSERRSACLPAVQTGWSWHQRLGRFLQSPQWLVQSGLALTSVLLLAISMPLWYHERHAVLSGTPAAITAAENSAEQIEQDNALLRSVDSVLNTTEVSPVSEYHMSSRPVQIPKARPESRNE